jgi:LysM repeat protein
MSKRILSFATLFLALLLLVSNENPVKQLYYFNDLKDYEGLEISHKPGVYEEVLSLTIKVPEGGRAELITNNKFRSVENEVIIDAPSVLKVSYRDNAGKRKHFVGNYIVNQKHELPVIALTVDTNDFFPPNGIYVGHMVPDTAGGDPITVGRAWNKQPITAHAQFFFNNDLKEELEIDLKTYGGMTLGWKEKSLQLSARKKLHGESKINVKAFRQLPFRKYQHLVLRTSGNDQNKTRLKDMSISMVADEINVNTKASRSVVLYVNGVYWGIHNVREKVNGDYYRYRYGWKKGSFWEIQGSGFRDPTYKSLIDYVRLNHADDDFHQRVSDSIDVENFFNYNIIETFISNTDYRGNVRFFKPVGGKWKWVLYDVDLACDHSFLNRNFIRDRTFPVSEHWYNPPYAIDLLKHMLMNDKFKERFVKQYNYLMATKLRPSNFFAKIDENIEVMEPELERHWGRRDRLYNETRSSWNKQVRKIKSFLEKRPPSAIRHLQEVFKLGEPQRVNVTQNIKYFEGLSMNASDICVDEIDGEFFTEYKHDLEAIESNHLYQFKNWSDGVNDKKRVLDLTSGAVEIEARFEHIDTSSNQSLKIRRYYVNNDRKEGLLFVSLINPTGQQQSLKGVTLYEDKSGSRKDLSDVTLDVGEEVVLTNSRELFSQNIQNEGVKVLNFMEGMTFANDVMFALIDKEGWIDSLQYTVSDSLLIEHPGFLIEKDSSGVQIDNVKLKNMKGMTFGIEIPESMKEEEKDQSMIWWVVGAVVAVVAGAVLFFVRRKKNQNLGMLILLIGLSGNAFAQPTADTAETAETVLKDSTESIAETKRVTADKYGLSSIEKRVIDNKGRGDERFYGTRNFRVVLYDLVYRGGGNNLFLRDTIPKYYLWNPMPSWGLKQLSDIGFDKAVYLYSHNFEYWYPQARLDSLDEAGFEYICRPKLTNYLDDYLQDVMDRANDTTSGAMYIHCWNGWHQSGLLSAYTLMQFCDYSNYEALKYWETCTDGNYRGFSKVKSRIRNYKPSEKYYFTEEQQKRYCPCEKDVSGPAAIQSDDDKINLSADEMMEKGSTGSSSNKYSYHTIRSGESLGRIAEKYGMGLSELQRLNGMRGTTIYAGKKLKVIDRKGVKSTSKKSTSSSSSSGVYRVKSGDSLYGIARKHGTTISAIKKANSLKSDTIFPGQKLKIP